MRKINLLFLLCTFLHLSAQSQSFIDDLSIKFDTTLFNGPSALYVEGNSDVLVVDAYNNAIRRLKWDGNSETVVKTATSPTSPSNLLGIVDLTKDEDGNIYVLDAPQGNLKKITPTGTITVITGNGSSNSAVFGQPSGIAYNKKTKSLVVCLNWSHSIYYIDLNGTIIKTFGNGLQGYTNGTISEAQFRYPKDVAVDSDGNVFVSEQGNHTIRMISPLDIVSTYAGSIGSGFVNGTKLDAKFDNPDRLEFNSNGDLFVSELTSSRVRKIHKDKDTVSTFASAEAADKALVTINASIGGMSFLDEKDFIFTYQNKHSVNLSTFAYYNSYMTPITYFGIEDKSGYKEGFANNPNLGFNSVAVDSKGNIFLAPYGTNIFKLDAAGKLYNYSGSLYKNGYGDGTPNTIRYFGINSISIDADDNLYVAEDYYADIKKVDVNGIATRIAGTGQAPGVGQIIDADGIAIEQKLLSPRTPLAIASHEVLFADAMKIRKIKNDGYLSSVSASAAQAIYKDKGPATQTKVASVMKMISLPDGTIYMIHAGKSYITRSDGSTFKVICDTISGYRDGDLDSARFNQPWDLTVDKVGNVFVYDMGLNNIRMIDKKGNVITLIDFNSTNLKTSAGAEVQSVIPINIAYHPDGYLITSNFKDGQLSRINISSVTTDLFENVAPVAIKVYPNPNEGKFLVQCKEQVIKTELFTADGKTETYFSEEINTRLSGLVLVKVTSVEGVYSTKVLIK